MGQQVNIRPARNPESIQFIRQLDEIVGARVLGCFADFQRAVQGLEAEAHVSLTQLAIRGISEETLVRSEAVRVACVRVLIALLPGTVELVSQLLNRRSHRYHYEVHFTLFVYLDHAREMPEAGPSILALVAGYLRDIDRDTALAAWMAGDLLGDHWTIETALPVLLELASRAKYVAGRKGALHGLGEILRKPQLPRGSRKRVIALLKSLRKADRSATIRRRARTLLEKAQPCNFRPPVSGENAERVAVDAEDFD